LEKDAATAFYSELGRRMGLGPVPASFDAACRFLDEYEDRNLGPSPEGAAFLAATVPALENRLPAPLRRFSPLVLALMMDKPEVAVPGTANIAVYPDGYTLDQIGPGAITSVTRR
jgi:hypothetical protein